MKIDMLEAKLRVGLALSLIDRQVACGDAFVAPCPVCETGTLTWHRSYFGKVRLGCSTPDCLPPVKFKTDRRKPWPPELT